jgi:hypothetical protein
MTKEFGVGTELRKLHRPLCLESLKPTPALPMHVAGEASDAPFVASHVLEASDTGRINADARHHAAHQVGLASDPIQYRPAQAKIAHAITSLVTNRILLANWWTPLDLDQPEGAAIAQPWISGRWLAANRSILRRKIQVPRITEPLAPTDERRHT